LTVRDEGSVERLWSAEPSLSPVSEGEDEEGTDGPGAQISTAAPVRQERTECCWSAVDTL